LSQNDNLDAARQYHSGTKHSYLSIRMHPHVLDWENKPLLFKIYPTLEVTRLPRDFHDTGKAALAAIADTSISAAGQAVPDLETLAQILFFTAGVTRSKKHAQGEAFFRAAACTGALTRLNSTLPVLIFAEGIRSRTIPRRFQPASITLGRQSSACGSCGRETCGRRWLTPQGTSPRSNMRP